MHEVKLTRQGRKVLIVTRLDALAFHTASMLQQIDIGVTLRSAADVYKEEVVGLCLQWLSDMCKVTICGEEDLFRKYVAMALFEPRSQSTVWEGTPLAPDLAHLERGIGGGEARRFDWLMRLDVRLWKRAKWQLREIYSGIFVLGWDIKREFATRYSINYGHTFEHYLYQERDDSSLAFSMSYMLLGRNSACGEAIVESKLFSSVLDTAYNYYASRPPPSGDAEAAKPLRDRFDIDSPAFRGKKGLTLLSHLRALLKYKEVKAQLVQDPELFQRTLDFLNHFVGLQSQRKELDKHVEYEIDWVKSISVLPDLTKLAREFGESFRSAEASELLNALHNVAQRIVDDLTLKTETLDATLYSKPEFKTVTGILTPSSHFDLYQLDISHITGFSFHHYMHLVLAEMLKSFSATSFAPDSTAHAGRNFIDIVERDIIRAPSAKDVNEAKLLIIEWPLQSKLGWRTQS